MPPRFMQRLQRQSDTLREVFGEPQFDPPPYPFSRSRATSTTSSMPDSASSASMAPPSYYRATQTVTQVDSPCLPRGSMVLVIGANGWLGSHVVEQLLEHGYNVRGAVRSHEKALLWSKIFGDRYGSDRFTAVVVQNMTVPGAYNTAIRGCEGVVHAASVTTFSADPNEVIPPTIMGALNALDAAGREPKIRRFVYCSSIAAAANPGTGVRSDISRDSWNMSAFKTAWEPGPYDPARAWAVFAASKMQAEQAVWRYYREKRPNFVLNTVLPGMLWGRSVAATELPASGMSMQLLKSVYESNPAAMAWTPPQHFADVRDAAQIHLAALVLPGVMNERLFVTAMPYNINSLTLLLRGLCPQRHIDGWLDDHGVDQTTYTEAGRAEDLLRRLGRKGWTDIETSVSQACEAFV